MRTKFSVKNGVGRIALFLMTISIIGYSTKVPGKTPESLTEDDCAFLYQETYTVCHQFAVEKGQQACVAAGHTATENMIKTGEINQQAGAVMTSVCSFGCSTGARGSLLPYDQFRQVVCQITGSQPSGPPVSGLQPQGPSPSPGPQQPGLPQLNPNPPSGGTVPRRLELDIKVGQIMQSYVHQASEQCMSNVYASHDCQKQILLQLTSPENVQQIAAAAGATPQEYNYVGDLIGKWAMNPYGMGSLLLQEMQILQRSQGQSGFLPQSDPGASRSSSPLDCYQNCSEARRNCDRVCRFYPSQGCTEQCSTEEHECRARCS